MTQRELDFVILVMQTQEMLVLEVIPGTLQLQEQHLHNCQQRQLMVLHINMHCLQIHIV